MSLPVEQCSSQETAVHKSRLVQGEHLVDLTGGLGVDSYFFSKRFKQITYVEEQSALCELARHNFTVLNATNIQILQGESSETLNSIKKDIDCIYLDPDRRQGQQKTTRLEECRPNVYGLLPKLWQRSSSVMIKLSPMMDVMAAVSLLGSVHRVQAVSVENDCKELLLLLEKDFQRTTRYDAVNLRRNGDDQVTSFTKEEESNTPLKYSKPLRFLYEPNSSILKLGAFKLIGERLELYKLHPNSHLYTSDGLSRDFPGRIFEIRWTSKYHPKKIKALLPEGKANVAIRNFPLDVATIRKACSLKEGGNHYLFGTRGPENEPIMVCGNRL